MGFCGGGWVTKTGQGLLGLDSTGGGGPRVRAFPCMLEHRVGSLCTDDPWADACWASVPQVQTSVLVDAAPLHSSGHLELAWPIACLVQHPSSLNTFSPGAHSWSTALSFSCSEPATGRPCKLWHLLSVKIQLIPEGRLNISEF